ncbi:MAG TPA: aldo/keto reductase [Bryobacteraceae bacterium]|jgi:aryl-alcohol dehydrogenase-like predicted oxidoreductase|nr:aldo/keto reductase [Bryobacteraceae bacterium]
MFATIEATTRYCNRFPQYLNAQFYRGVFGLQVSSLGIGTYLGGDDDASDQAYTDALIAAGESGINFFDTAINYRNQRSERCVGAALQHLQRDEIVICTKAGFLTPGAVPKSLRPEDIVGRMHSMAPDFLADQIDRSLSNMGLETIDVFYLHNPETQLGFVSRAEFDQRLRAAFTKLEELVSQEKIRWYGAATWEGFRKKDALSLPRMAEIATEVGGPEHHFRFIQLPFNLGMVEAFVDRPESALAAAERLGIAAVASGALMQGQVLSNMPDAVTELLPGLSTAAQRAIQFTRSTPGISVALVGMGRREHVEENIGVAQTPPAAREQYLRLYQ